MYEIGSKKCKSPGGRSCSIKKKKSAGGGRKKQVTTLQIYGREDKLMYDCHRMQRQGIFTNYATLLYMLLISDASC